MSDFLQNEKVLDKQIESMFSTKNESKTDLLMKLVSFCIYENSTNTDIANLFRILEKDDFIKVLTLFSNRTIHFPSKTEIRDYFIVALTYYYREICKLEWEDVKKKIPFDISSISYSVKVKKLKNFITQKTEEALKEHFKQENKGDKNGSYQLF